MHYWIQHFYLSEHELYIELLIEMVRHCTLHRHHNTRGTLFKSPALSLQNALSLKTYISQIFLEEIQLNEINAATSGMAEINMILQKWGEDSRTLNNTKVIS